MSTAFVFPSFLAISPFGPSCKHCSVPLAVEKGIYSHGKTFHPDDSFQNQVLVRDVKAKMAELRKLHSRDLSPFLVPGSTMKEMWFCTGCFVSYGKYSNYKRHFDSRCNKECVDIAGTRSFCYATVCFRLGPKTCNPPCRVSAPYPPLISDVTTMSPLTQPKTSTAICMVSGNIKVPAALMTTLDEAMEILKPFVRSDEYASDLALIFYPLLSPTFEGTMRQYLEFSSKRQSEDPILTKWIEAGHLWLTNYASAHVANVSANVRHRLSDFEQHDIGGAAYGTRTFTLRRDIPRLERELQTALRFFYRFPTSLFDEFKTEEVKHSDLDWMIERAIIPRILVVAAKEEPTDHGTLPVACRYCLSLGFTIKNQVQLVMNECGWLSSRISAVLHLLSAGICGYLVTLSMDGSQDLTNFELELIKTIQNGRVTNLLVPYVKELRDLNARKPRVKDKAVNGNGDITSGAFTFPKSIWSTIIPRTCQIAKTCFGEVFQGTSWEYFLTLPIKVVDWVDLDAYVETGDSTVSLKDLALKENPDDILAKLQSIAQLCLLGFGVGAIHHEEVVRLKVKSCQWHNSYLYYWTEPVQQGSLKGSKKLKVIGHRLSLTMSRIFLLLRYSFVANSCGGFEELLPTLPGASMLSLVCDIFDFDCIPQMLNIRHLFTSIGNILLPENNSEGSDAVLVSNVALTEKFDHCQGTTRREKSDEALYDLYHKSLGEVLLDPPVITFTPYSDSVLQNALKELMGVNAAFCSRQQKIMVEIASNSVTRHSYVGIPCFHAKSLSWFIPTMASYLAGRQVGLRIVILPYKFLLGNMVQQAVSMFGALGDTLRVEFVDSRNMDEESVATLLQGKSLPALLFLNLDGASKLLQSHMARLQSLACNNVLKRVYIDEFQELVTEFGSRSAAYQALRELGRIGVPVMCLSGSMPLSIATSLMSYCRLMLDDRIDSIDIVQGCDPIGDDFQFDVRTVANIESSIAKFVLQSPDTACHVICDTKVLVQKVVKVLSGYRNVLSVTGDTSSKEQMRCAEQWSKGIHNILVSTIIGVVGNENKKCKKLVIGGFLYNVSSLVQAIGCLRREQRGPGSSVTIFRSAIHSKSREKAKEIESNAFRDLVSARCLKEDLAHDYSRIFSPIGLQEFLRMKEGCYLQSLSQMYGFARSPCEHCGLCLKWKSMSNPASSQVLSMDSSITCKRNQLTVKESPVQTKRVKRAVERKVQTAKIRSNASCKEERNVRSLADCVFRELLYRCIVCGLARCNGSCMCGCDQCGDKYHRSTICSFDTSKLTTILPNKGVCFGCFDTRLRGMEKHSIEKCPLRRRLKCLLFIDRARTNSPFDEYLRSLYTDEMTFLKMVASFESKVTLGRMVSRPRMEKQKLQCTQVGLEAPNAPLLPPDIVHKSKDISVDGLVRSTNFKDKAQARSRYKELKLEKSSVRRRRKFVFGSLYHNLFPGYFKIDPLVRDMDLIIKTESKTQSILQIRLVSPEDSTGKENLFSAGISLGRSLGLRGNARGAKVGDAGCMHALGYRSANKKVVYVMKDDIPRKAEVLSRLMRDWMEENMKGPLKNMIAVDRKLKVAYTLPFMPTGPGSRMMVSVNLANAAHLDVDDTSMSVALWLEERPGQAVNWYFILPNTSYEGSTGVVVKLRHGTVISWDAREIFHCTAKTEVGKDNRVYGCMWGSCKA